MSSRCWGVRLHLCRLFFGTSRLTRLRFCSMDICVNQIAANVVRGSGWLGGWLDALEIVG